MAEAIAVLGAAAAALQFAETGYKVISRCSSLMKRSREYPDYLHRTHSQMQHLIYLAKVAAENRGTFEVVTSSELQNAIVKHQQPQSVDNQPESSAVISIQMETIWKDCAHQADVIDNILQSMMREIEGKGLIEKWRKLSLHERVCSIDRALGELERSKTTLGLWLGNESLYRLGRMHHNLAMMQTQIMHSERKLSRMFEEYHKKTENAVLATIQPTPAVKSLDDKMYGKQKSYADFQRNDRERAPSVVMPFSPNQNRNLNKAKSSATGRRPNYIKYPAALLPSFMKVEWSKVLTFAGNTIVLQLGSQGKKSLTFASEDVKNMFLNVYMRLRIAWLFDTVELSFSFEQYPGNPSIRASLKSLIRGKSLPLQGLFMDIYGHRCWRRCERRGSELLQRRSIPTQEEQLHLFSVGRKLLLESFYAGDASPNVVSETGETLLHLQARLYHPGYETLFTKMTEFLVSMSVDTEVVDDYFRTAQSILCDRLIIYDRLGNNFSHAVAAESRLTWSGSLEKRAIVGSTMSASEILQCIRVWPEAILDTEYHQICDIVLRKSITDLHKLPDQKDLLSMQGDKPISPLHFAAAVSWPAGVETLISMGYSRFQIDGNGETPLDIAVDVGCIPAVEALLEGDCLAFLDLSTQDKDTALPLAFLEVAESDNSSMHDIIIECLLRHKFLLPGLTPYHDLASQRYADNIGFAQKLFIAGFQDIEVYNHYGYTPLMLACTYGNIRMASFLLQHGANPSKSHEYACLRAGHFLYYDGIHDPGLDWRDDDLIPLVIKGVRFREDEKRLLEAAFDTSIDIHSCCRCSPDGLSPITSLFRGILGIGLDTYHLKEGFQRMIRNVDCSPADMKRHWRAFVVCETFNRIGMTHTCLQLHSPGRLFPGFPDNRRIEIEDEEEELFFELEEVVARFDLFSENRQDDLSECVDEFFDDLDGYLRPRSSLLTWTWRGKDKATDCLGPGEDLCVGYYLSSRGKQIKYGYKEIIKEDSMLRWLFP